MNRRELLFVPIAIVASTACSAAEQPWLARLLKGGFDGAVWWSGLEITLAPHWKTYWRVPGDGGIAPALDISGDNIKSSRVDYPVPHRIVGESGTTIGYRDTVVFPIAVTPMDATRPVAVNLKAFFGVCDEVCIPAPFDADVRFDPARAIAPDQMLISTWQAEVPVLRAEGPVTKVVAKREGEAIVVLFDTSEQITDIFVEGNPLHYFGNPMVMRGLVRMTVAGAKSVDELLLTPLRLTMRTKFNVLEQMVTVV